ncbi:hypothetical protein [Chryseobacterium sp. GVT01B]|uniref:hypothetical protein n=1 Tax=Chryseobacterium sp. GVT01B TaxID=2862675 RepID=UPI001CC06C56|nr:hypothetical protein [Chryseobacterium sp. GVT01B]
MKTKILLLFLLGWVGMVFSQVRLLSDYKSRYPNVSNAKTFNDFIKKINENDKREEIIKLIEKNTGLNINKIDGKTVANGILKYQQIYLVNEKPVFINLNNQSIFIIERTNGEKFFFYPKAFIFLTETNQNPEDIIRSKLDSTFFSIGYKCIAEKNKHNAKVIHDSVFIDDFKILKRAVVLNSADNVTDNNAIAFTSGNDTKLSIGANFNYRDYFFMNISAYTSSINSGLFYSDKSWRNDIGASFTFNVIIPSQTRFFNPKKCTELCQKRDKYYNDTVINNYDSLKSKYDQKLLTLFSNGIEKIKKELNNDINENEKLEKYEKLERYEKIVSNLKEKNESYEKIIAEPSKYINDSIIAFDKKNIGVLNGSRLEWIKTTIDIYNQNIDLDTAIIKKNIAVENQIKNYPRINVNFSYNLNRQYNVKLMKLINLQIFSNFIMGNLLNANTGSEKPVLEQRDDKTFIVDKYGRTLGEYSYLKRAFWTLQSGVQASAFITNNFGVMVYAYHTFALQNMDYMDYRNRYALQGGLIFRINDEEDVNKATFRIMAGIDNEPYHTRALKNSFMVKVSIGIPFGLFIKSKK